MNIDLNADLGESWDRWQSGEDVELLKLVTSVNVCCGADAGDADLMLATCEAAVERGVAIGALVGCPDRDGSGRIAMDLDDATLIETVRSQIDALAIEADAAGGTVSYVKLHDTIVTDERKAAAVVEAVIAYGLPLLGPPDSMSMRLAADEGLPVVTEGSADLACAPDEAAAQAVALMARVESISVHAGSSGALATAQAVRAALEAAGATLMGLHH